MGKSREDKFIQKLEQEVGDSLRVVATYNDEDYYPVYIRDDVDKKYTNEEREKIYKERVLKGISKEYVEDLYHAGELNTVVEILDEAIIFQFPRDDSSGLHIAVDHDMDLHVMGLVETVESEIDSVLEEIEK